MSCFINYCLARRNPKESHFFLLPLKYAKREITEQIISTEALRSVFSFCTTVERNWGPDGQPSLKSVLDKIFSIAKSDTSYTTRSGTDKALIIVLLHVINTAE